MTTARQRGFILAVLNRKGGAGKTTTVTNLVMALVARGLRVAIFDADPQQTSAKWSARRAGNRGPNMEPADPVEPAITVLGSSKERGLAADIKAMAEGWDVLLVDGPAKTDVIELECIKAADTVLIPVQPTPIDLQEVVDTVMLVHDRREMTDGVQPNAVFVIKRARRGTVLGRTIDDKLLELALPVLETRLHDYEVYPQAYDPGMGVVEFAPGSAAANETIALVDELIANNLLKVPT